MSNGESKVNGIVTLMKRIDRQNHFTTEIDALCDSRLSIVNAEAECNAAGEKAIKVYKTALDKASQNLKFAAAYVQSHSNDVVIDKTYLMSLIDDNKASKKTIDIVLEEAQYSHSKEVDDEPINEVEETYVDDTYVEQPEPEVQEYYEPEVEVEAEAEQPVNEEQYVLDESPDDEVNSLVDDIMNDDIRYEESQQYTEDETDAIVEDDLADEEIFEEEPIINQTKTNDASQPDVFIQGAYFTHIKDAGYVEDETDDIGEVEDIESEFDEVFSYESTAQTDADVNIDDETYESADTQAEAHGHSVSDKTEIPVQDEPVNVETSVEQEPDEQGFSEPDEEIETSETTDCSNNDDIPEIKRSRPGLGSRTKSVDVVNNNSDESYKVKMLDLNNDIKPPVIKPVDSNVNKSYEALSNTFNSSAGVARKRLENMTKESNKESSDDSEGGVSGSVLNESIVNKNEKQNVVFNKSRLFVLIIIIIIDVLLIGLFIKIVYRKQTETDGTKLSVEQVIQSNYERTYLLWQ